MRTPGPEAPQEAPETRRERRREQQERTSHRRRRLLAALPLLIGLLAGLLLLPALMGEKAVARLAVPTVEPGPEAPTAEDPPSGESKSGSQASPQTDSEPATGDTSVETELTEGNKETLRSELQRIERAYPATYGVVVSDPSTGETLAMYADQRFLAASLNKLPVLMTLYRAAAAGEVDLDDEISMQASDVQAYGTGVLYTYPIGYTITLRECANYLIKKSDNTAWKMLDRYLGRDYVRAELYRVGARSTEYWLPNTTTPNDILLMLQKISDPSYTSPDLSAEMLDLMQNTDFEDRLPQPLPQGARVSHKIGYYGSTYADAGVIFPEGARDASDAYFVVVMASDTTELTSRAATQEMSLATYRVLSKPTQPDAKDTPKKGHR